MNEAAFQSMYGYFFKAGGEGSRGGKVIGHTASGKPIYDSEQRRDVPKIRKPYPGEEAHKLPEMPEAQKRRTYMPVTGTEYHYTDSPNLRAYKILMRQFKRQGIDFMGHISYDPKSDKMLAISQQAPALIRKVYDSFMAEHQAKKPRAG
jgi:hypothetical protein